VLFDPTSKCHGSMAIPFVGVIWRRFIPLKWFVEAVFRDANPSHLLPTIPICEFRCTCAAASSRPDRIALHLSRNYVQQYRV
jgi:hypothetical protein